MKLVTFEDIRCLKVEPGRCIEWAAEAIRSKGNAILPPKISLHPGPDEAFCNFMPSIVPDTAGNLWGGVKVVTRYPGRAPALESRLLLFDAGTGEQLALMDADWITAMRTGAVAAHSIDLLAKGGYSVVGFMGLGNTARAVMLCLISLLGNRDVEVKLLEYKGQENWFAERFSGLGNLLFRKVGTVEELVLGSDVVVSAVTYSAEDFCADSCFDEGVLVVPVHTRGFTNCDLFFDKVFADDRGHVRHFGNFEKFRRFAEVADVVNGRASGRESDSERIIVYNIGVSMQDVVFAAHIWQMLDRDALPDFDLRQPKGKYWV